MKHALALIINDPALSDECKQMAVAYESGVQWYLATCEAIAERRDFSPLVGDSRQQVAA